MSGEIIHINLYHINFTYDLHILWKIKYHSYFLNKATTFCKIN